MPVDVRKRETPLIAAMSNIVAGDTFADMRDLGVRGLLIYCADYRCSHSIALSADQWPMTFAYPILSQASPARSAASAGPTCGPTSCGTNCYDRGHGYYPGPPLGMLSRWAGAICILRMWDLMAGYTALIATSDLSMAGASAFGRERARDRSPEPAIAPSEPQRDMCPGCNSGKILLCRTTILTPQLLERASRSNATGGARGLNLHLSPDVIVLTKLTAPACRQDWSRSFVLVLQFCTDCPRTVIHARHGGARMFLQRDHPCPKLESRYLGFRHGRRVGPLTA